MARVEIYTKSWCPYCRRATALLTRKGVDYTEYEVSRDRDLESEMIRRAAATTSGSVRGPTSPPWPNTWRDTSATSIPD